MANLYEAHARAKAGLGPEFRMARWEGKAATKTKPEHMRVTLMVAPLLDDGRVAWDYAEQGTRTVVEFSHADHEAYLLQWERDTGKCHQCATGHPGQEFAGWSQARGAEYRVCHRCHGSGLAQGGE